MEVSIEARVRHHAPKLKLAASLIVGFVAGIAESYSSLADGQFLFALHGSHVVTRATREDAFESVEFVLSGVQNSSFIRIDGECFELSSSEVFDLMKRVRSDVAVMSLGEVMQKHYRCRNSEIIIE